MLVVQLKGTDRVRNTTRLLLACACLLLEENVVGNPIVPISALNVASKSLEDVDAKTKRPPCARPNLRYPALEGRFATQDKEDLSVFRCTVSAATCDEEVVSDVLFFFASSFGHFYGEHDRKHQALSKAIGISTRSELPGG